MYTPLIQKKLAKQTRDHDYIPDFYSLDSATILKL